jgi:ketosteroid isomerase-like protein
MRRYNWILVLAIAAVLACTPELSQRQILLERDQVEARLETWSRAMNNARTDTLAMLYHKVPELVVTWMDGKQTKGWDETKEAWEEFYRTTDYMNFVVQPPVIQILAPDVAVTTFRHSTDIVRRAKRLPVAAGYATIVWVKDDRDDLWKIHISQIGVDRPSEN